MKIILKDFHYQWIERNFSKLAKTRKNKEDRKLLQAIADKASGNPSFLKLNKTQAVALSQAAEAAVHALAAAKKKYETSPLEYKEYINKVQEREILMKEMLDKIKRKLK